MTVREVLDGYPLLQEAYMKAQEISGNERDLDIKYGSNSTSGGVGWGEDKHKKSGVNWRKVLSRAYMPSHNNRKKYEKILFDKSLNKVKYPNIEHLRVYSKLHARIVELFIEKNSKEDSSLTDGFIWSSTKEGEFFWAKVATKNFDAAMQIFPTYFNECTPAPIEYTKRTDPSSKKETTKEKIQSDFDDMLKSL